LTAAKFKPFVFSVKIGRSVKLLLAFANIAIPGFSLLEIHDQNLYSLLDMHVFLSGASSSTKEGFCEQSESELLYALRFTANQFVLPPSLLRITIRDLLRSHLLRQSRDLVSVETCLQSHCLATAVSSGSAIPAFRRHVTLFSNPHFNISLIRAYSWSDTTLIKHRDNFTLPYLIHAYIHTQTIAIH
jgi:hypothetical protein